MNLKIKIKKIVKNLRTSESSIIIPIGFMCVLFWCPLIIAEYSKNFDYSYYIGSAVVSIIFSICSLIEWIGLLEIFQEKKSNHADNENDYYIDNCHYKGAFGNEMKNLKKSIDCTKILFFGTVLIAIMFVSFLYIV